MFQFLLRIATTTDQSSGQNFLGVDPYSLVRRALVIIRRAVKPQVFGGIPIRTNYLERQLNLPQPHEHLTAEQQYQQNAVYTQITQTVDVISAIAGYLVRKNFWSKNFPKF
jgi:hypothetical protein